jgi:hypothetical protein
VKQGGKDLLVAVHVDTITDALQLLLILSLGLLEGLQLDQQVSVFQIPQPGQNVQQLEPYELAPQLGAGSEVLGAQDDGIDHAKQGDNIGHIVTVRQFIHDDTEAVLLVAHGLVMVQGIQCQPMALR